MFFVFNLRPSSQSECRRFDPGLPRCIAFLETMRNHAETRSPLNVLVGGDSSGGLLKMYCFCTAEMPNRAILAISEDVISAMGESLQLLIFPVPVAKSWWIRVVVWIAGECSSPALGTCAPSRPRFSSFATVNGGSSPSGNIGQGAMVIRALLATVAMCIL